MNALEELKKWKRKGYRYILDSCTSVMAGDYEYITLKNGLREVKVFAEDFANEENDYAHASTEFIILEAIRQWHSDPNPKHFRVYCHASNLDQFPLPDTLKCQWWGNQKSMIEARLIAKNDEEAIQMLRD